MSLATLILIFQTVAVLLGPNHAAAEKASLEGLAGATVGGSDLSKLPAQLGDPPTKKTRLRLHDLVAATDDESYLLKLYEKLAASTTKKPKLRLDDLAAAILGESDLSKLPVSLSDLPVLEKVVKNTTDLMSKSFRWMYDIEEHLCDAGNFIEQIIMPSCQAPSLMKGPTTPACVCQNAEMLIDSLRLGCKVWQRPSLTSVEDFAEALQAIDLPKLAKSLQ